MPDRLVIRIKIPSDAPPRVPERRRLSAGALLLIACAAVIVLGAIGFMMFRAEPTPVPAAPAVKAQPPAETKPSSPPVESQTPPAQSAPPPDVNDAINEVVPDVPRSARQTISGTIKVMIRVIVDKDGKVVAATTDVPGPSRYFERLALEAARQWTFPPSAQERRVMRVTFSYRRSGTTAESSPL